MTKFVANAVSKEQDYNAFYMCQETNVYFDWFLKSVDIKYYCPTLIKKAGKKIANNNR